MNRRWLDVLSQALGSSRGHQDTQEPATERWLAVDVETSGLDLRRDRVIAIAAIGLKVDWRLKRLSIVPADSFETVLRQEMPSTTPNILLHGIGAQRQREASVPADALDQFRRFAGNSPLLAFHAAFDEGMLKASVREHLGQDLNNEWADIEHLCAVIREDIKARSMDEWMSRLGVTCAARHQAAADTLAAAELLCHVWPGVARQCRSWKEVRSLSLQHRWIRR